MSRDGLERRQSEVCGKSGTSGGPRSTGVVHGYGHLRQFVDHPGRCQITRKVANERIVTSVIVHGRQRKGGSSQESRDNCGSKRRRVQEERGDCIEDTNSMKKRLEGDDRIE